MREAARTALGLAWRVVLFEVRLYRSLLRWLARRPHVPDGTEPVGYAQAVTPVMSLWIFASAVEIPVIHLLVPWDGVRLALLGLGVWGLAWMLGLLASLRVYPHLVDDDRIRVRHGATVDVEVPWDQVRAVVLDRRDLPSSIRTLQPLETPSGTDLRVGVSAEVNVRMDLTTPLTVPTRTGPLDVTAVSFLVDDPRAFVGRARQLVPSA